MKKDQHEVIIDGEMHINDLPKEEIDILCTNLLRDVLKRYQMP